MGDETSKSEGINDPLTQTDGEAPQTKWGGDEDSATDEDDGSDDHGKEA